MPDSSGGMGAVTLILSILSAGGVAKIIDLIAVAITNKYKRKDVVSQLELDKQKHYDDEERLFRDELRQSSKDEKDARREAELKLDAMRIELSKNITQQANLITENSRLREEIIKLKAEVRRLTVVVNNFDRKLYEASKKMKDTHSFIKSENASNRPGVIEPPYIPNDADNKPAVTTGDMDNAD